MSRYYFLKTIAEGSSNRLRALPNQTFNDGSAVPTDLNIQADSRIRARCPIGTVFATERLEIRQNRRISSSTGQSMSPFMAAIGGIFPIGIPEDPQEATADMMTGYEAYAKANPVKPGQEAEDTYGNTAEAEQSASLLKRIRTDKRWTRPTVKSDGFSIDQSRWEMMMTFIHNHDNLLLTGPSGTGKTELVMLACRRQGIDCRKYNMGTMSDPMSALLGVHRIKNGKSVFEPSQFLEDIQKPGVILLDEINRAPLNALNYLMSCLDGTRQMRNDYVSPVQLVDVHPECTFIATANIGAEFVGTNIIDPALNSRFFRLQMEYPSVNEEASVLAGRFSIKMDDALNIAKIAKDIRDNYDKGELSTNVTVRQTLMAAKLVSCGYGVMDALVQIFLPYFEGTTTEGEKAIVHKMFFSR